MSSVLQQPATGSRSSSTVPGHDQLTDQFADARCLFLRFYSDSSYSFPDVDSVSGLAAGGWLLKGKAASYWLPCLPVARKLDPQGHILTEEGLPLSGLQMDCDGLTIKISVPTDQIVDCVLWELPPELVDELSSLTALETQPRFLWGSHSCYTKPADLYLHLVYGSVYENRSSWPKHWKINSENDAHSLYVLLCGLERMTNKKIYALLQQQLLLSVIHRQSEDGGWYHGEWTDDMESHFRLHTSALHLLTDAYAAHPEPITEQALKNGINFLVRQADQLNDGLWFLHDSLETSEASMNTSPFRWVPSQAFGKSISNMLVLNSHWDTTVVTDRAGQLLDIADWHTPVAESNKATLHILAARPAKWLYGMLFHLVELSFLPKDKAVALPVWKRALKRVGWKYIIPRFHFTKARFPRLVMPGGFLDRGLSLKGVSGPYQAINVMDLIRLQRRFPSLALRTCINNAIEYTYCSGLWENWSEDKRCHYAYGFWAEALYHLCLLDTNTTYRDKLVRTLQKMQHHHLGLPPSLLGANREAVVPADRTFDFAALPASVEFADLSSSQHTEILLMNLGKEAVSVDLQNLAPDLQWRTVAGTDTDTQVISLSSGEWISGQ